MQRVAWKAALKPGMREEYKRRHDEIWPEMSQLIDVAGIRNYTIWNSGEDLFGYYEVDDKAASDAVLASSPITARWNVYMQDVMDLEMDSATGTVSAMTCLFKHL